MAVPRIFSPSISTFPRFCMDVQCMTPKRYGFTARTFLIVAAVLERAFDTLRVDVPTTTSLRFRTQD